MVNGIVSLISLSVFSLLVMIQNLTQQSQAKNSWTLLEIEMETEDNVV